MSLIIEPLRQEHLNEIRVTVQPMQSDFGNMLLHMPDFLTDMRQSGPCVGFVKDARVLGVAGLLIYPRTGRSVLWCAYADGLVNDFFKVFRKGMKSLLAEDWRRVEAYVDPNFNQARRLALLAGFKYEGTMQRFWHDGSDRELWARIR